MYELMCGYFKWLGSNSTYNELKNGVVELTVPFLDSKNDWMQIYIVDQGDEKYLISDDGNTLNDTPTSLSSKVDHLKKIISRFGVQIDNNNAIYAIAEKKDLYTKMNSVIQAIMYINGAESL